MHNTRDIDVHHPILKKQEKVRTWWPSMCSGQKLVLVSRAPWLARNRFWDNHHHVVLESEYLVQGFGCIVWYDTNYNWFCLSWAEAHPWSWGRGDCDTYIDGLSYSNSFAFFAHGCLLIMLYSIQLYGFLTEDMSQDMTAEITSYVEICSRLQS